VEKRRSHLSFFAPFFVLHFPRIACRTQFFRSSTLFALLIEKGGEKKGKKRREWQKGRPGARKRASKKGGVNDPIFGTLFRALFSPFPAELQVGPRFCWSSTLFSLLIENGQKTKRMAKKVRKGEKKGLEVRMAY
jgi:hypothetical protein